MKLVLGPTWRVARALALSRDPRQRWRQLSLVTTGAIAAFVVLLGAALISSGHLSSAHLQARKPVLAASVEEATALWSDTMPILPGGVGQVPVHWIEPLEGHESDPSLIPPGLDQLPAPGTMVISPGLDRVGITATDLGLEVSDAGQGEHGLIGDAGLASRSEGFAIARPPEGQHLDRARAIPVTGYAGGTEAPRYPWTETSLDTLTSDAAWTGAAALLWFPAGLMLLGASRNLSDTLRSRGEYLWQQGVPRRAIRTLAGIEAGVLTTIGSALGAIVFTVTMWRAVSYPLVDTVLLPGHQLSAPLIPLLALVIPLFAGIAAATAPLHRERRGSRRSVPGLLRVVPLVAGLLAMLAATPVATVLTGRRDADLGFMILLGGGLATMIGIPLALPAIAAIVSGRLSSIGRPSLWLACRRVALGAGRLARTGALVGVMVFLVNSEVALYEGTRTSDLPTAVEGGDRKVWSVGAEDSPATFTADVIARAQEAGGQAVLQSDPARFPTCQEAAQFFGVAVTETGCENSTPSGRLAGLTIQIAEGAAPADTTSVDTVLVSGPLSWSETDVLALTAGSTAAQSILISGPDDDFLHPGAAWARAGLAAAALILLVGLLRAVGDRAVESARDQAMLGRAGLTPHEASSTSLQATMLPIVLAIPIGLLAAVLFALEGAASGYTITNLTLMSVVTAAIITISAVVTLIASQAEQRVLDRIT